MEREGHTHRIQHGGKIDNFLRDGALDRREPAECCGNHADEAERHAAKRAGSAIERIRRPMCMSSSTFASDASRMTASAASAVMSLLIPNATPTVAACIAGASLMPSPTNSVLPRLVSSRTMETFSSGLLLGIDVLDSHNIGQIADLGFAVA